jgi:hypothetical protein
MEERFEAVGPLVTGEGHETLTLSARTDAQTAFWRSGGEAVPDNFAVFGSHGASLEAMNQILRTGPGIPRDLYGSDPGERSRSLAEAQ